MNVFMLMLINKSLNFLFKDLFYIILFKNFMILKNFQKNEYN